MAHRTSNEDREKKFSALAEKEISSSERERAGEFLRSKKIALFIVTHNAERYIESIVERIGKEYLPLFAEIFIIDDSSTDGTFTAAKKIKERYPNTNFAVYRTPFNRGYGGNQKVGYIYCIEKHYDVVVLLHANGQYFPEFLPRVIAACGGDTDVVLASRMVRGKNTFTGGISFYRGMGNRVLTWVENKLLGTKLSEFHTGFRAYRISALRTLPFEFNSDGFHFDMQILIQAVAGKMKIREVSIHPNFGPVVSEVNGLFYAYNCIKSIIKYHLTQMGVFYERNYDLALFAQDNYQFKKSSNSLHQYVLAHLPLRKEMKTIELGSNRGILSSHLAEKVNDHTAVDIVVPDLAGRAKARAMDLDTPFAQSLGIKQYDCCVTLEVVEHMREPEKFLSEVFSLLKINGALFISTANIAYFLIRLSLLAGQFNYGKRGILDRTHTRLFTVKTMIRLLRQYGFEVQSVIGFAPPLTDLIRNSWTMRTLEGASTWLARVYPNLFAYNFLVIARRTDDARDIFEQTVQQP